MAKARRTKAAKKTRNLTVSRKASARVTGGLKASIAKKDNDAQSGTISKIG